jgi:hypothetical protein
VDLPIWGRVSVYVRRNVAGRSAAQRYKRLKKAWRHRVLGPRTGVLVFSVLLLLFLLIQHVRLSELWAMVIGSWFGALVAAWVLLPDVMMPGWIGKWQEGAWGEENTASELRRLKRRGWTVRHDVTSGDGPWNRDHIVAGGSVFLIDTKNLSDSTTTKEGKTLRVTHIEDPDVNYVVDSFPVRRQAYWLEREFEEKLGFPVAVQPVLAIWGRFPAEETWIGDMAVVHAARVADWIEARPANLLREDKRRLVSACVKRLPSAR